MSDRTVRQQPWGLTQEAFDALLSALHSDRAEAAQQYEHLRRKLTKFFTWERAPYPEEHADQTLNRVARKIEEGAQIQNFSSYLYRVASNVLHEAWHAQQKQQSAVSELARQIPAGADELAVAQNCLEGCLDKLLPESRALILEYYSGEGAAKIRNRQAMAAQLGIPLNALRNRALRLRERLEYCSQHCMESKSARDESIRFPTEGQGRRETAP